MHQQLKKLVSFAKRGEAIGSLMKISLLEFDVALQADDIPKMEEVRMKIHQLTDDQLDLQLQVKKIKDDHEAEILKRMRDQDGTYP